MRLLVVGWVCITLLGCSSSDGAPGDATQDASPLTIVTPTSLEVGDVLPLTVLERFPDGHTEDVSTRASVTSSSETLAVDGGQITGVRRGAATLTATVDAESTSLDLAVRDWSDPTLLATPLNKRALQINAIAEDDGGAVAVYTPQRAGAAFLRHFDPTAGWSAPESLDPVVVAGAVGISGGRVLVYGEGASSHKQGAAVWDPATGLGPFVAWPALPWPVYGAPQVTVSPNREHVVFVVRASTVQASEVVRWSDAETSILDPGFYNFAAAVDDLGRVVCANGLEYAIAQPDSDQVEGGAMQSPPQSGPSWKLQELRVSLRSDGSGVVTYQANRVVRMGIYQVQTYVVDVTDAKPAGAPVPVGDFRFFDGSPRVALTSKGVVLGIVTHSSQGGDARMQVVAYEPGKAPESILEEAIDTEAASFEVLDTLVADASDNVTLVTLREHQPSANIESFSLWVRAWSKPTGWRSGRGFDDSAWSSAIDARPDGTIVLLYTTLKHIVGGDPLPGKLEAALHF